MATRIPALLGDQLDDSIAGLGIVKNTTDDFTHKFDINVDDSTVEVTSGNIVQVKDGGITEPKLDASNAPGDGNVLTWDNGAGQFTWVDLDTNFLEEADLIFHETPTGLVNSSNTVYTIASTPVVGTEQVFLNGQLQIPGTSYTIAGDTITFTKAPRTGSILRVHYVVA